MKVTIETTSPQEMDQWSVALGTALRAEGIAFSRGFRDDLVRAVFRTMQTPAQQPWRCHDPDCVRDGGHAGFHTNIAGEAL